MSRILVTVGTDFHPFGRLVSWADGFAARHPEHEVFIQYGAARPPVNGERARLLDHAQLQTEIARADAVVCHGGPATITDIRRSGLVPVCVARDPSYHEHIDEHQLRFVQRVAGAGIVVAAPNVDALDALVGQALTRSHDASAQGLTAPSGVRRVGELIAALSPIAVTTAHPDPLTVVYIGGQGRSGTTLLERALGELPGVLNIGESVHLWDRGLRDNELCGCGQPFSACPFWRSVGEVAFGGWGELDADEAVALRFSVDRNRYLPLLLRPGLSPRYRQRHAQHLDRLAQLYRALAEVSGARVIIDSSKHASYALMLSQVNSVDLRVLHVVRDSRAVAHAWTKTIARPEAGGTPMPVYGPAKAAVLWDVQNAVIEQMQRRHPYLRVRYEDFVEAPKDVLLAAARFAGIDDGASILKFLDGDVLHVNPSHTVAGNPMRFASGDITIKSDESWQVEMPTSRRRFVSALTLPLQRHYGYGSRTR
ncbi:MAG: sulfotransferase [Actinomycetia bacterium]|nr:sulfotransferase [Actinomycetes bacterium]